MNFTEKHELGMTTVLQDYRTARDAHLTKWKLTNARNDMSFMRMCNTYANHFKGAMPILSFGETASLFAEVTSIIDGNPYGVSAVWVRMEPRNREAAQELLGCILGMLRAQ